jgi:hypothetical protein
MTTNTPSEFERELHNSLKQSVWNHNARDKATAAILAAHSADIERRVREAVIAELEYLLEDYHIVTFPLKVINRLNGHIEQANIAANEDATPKNTKEGE